MKLQKKTRKSRQRDRILEMLRQAKSHPTANWIYSRLRKEFPDLSMGTVYRNLGQLVEQGLVNKISFGSTFDHFDAYTMPHYHFICDRCGSIVDLDLPIDDSLTKRLRDATGLNALRHEIRLYGICEKCAGRK